MLLYEDEKNRRSKRPKVKIIVFLFGLNRSD